MDGALVALLVIIAVILIVAIAVLVFVFARQGPKQTIGGICTNTSDCTTGLACVDGTCRSGGGGTCMGNNDCATGLVCDNGMCLAPNGGTCLNDVQCAAGLVCINGKCTQPEQPPDTGTQVDVDGVPTFRFPGAEVLDVVEEDGGALFLVGNYGFRVKGSRSEEITFDRRIERVSCIGARTVGLSSGRLYYPEMQNGSHVRWNVLPWSPSNVYYIANTADRTHLWVQHTTASGCVGSLYQTSDGGATAKLVHQTQLPMGHVRIFGETQGSYIEIDQNAKVGNLYDEGTLVETIPGMLSGVIRGKSVEVLPPERMGSSVRMVGGKMYELRSY